MSSPRKTAALLFGTVFSLSLALLAQARAQAPAQAPRGSAGESFAVQDVMVDWILKSDVSALADGVLEKIELDIGKIADRDGAVVGTLHHKKAELYVAKATLAANNKAAENKGRAEFARASAVVRRNDELNRRSENTVSREEQEKARAEMKIAASLIEEAVENQKLAAAELELARQQLEEHTIRAPFPGVVYERLKNPGESVRTGDAIVRIGNLDKLRVFAYIPLDYSSRVKEGSIVEIRPRITGASGVTEKSYRGVITFIDPQIQPVAETAVRVYADFANPRHELKPGMKVGMTIFLDGAQPAAGAVGAANANPAPPALGSAGTVDLPALPR